MRAATSASVATKENKPCARRSARLAQARGVKGDELRLTSELEGTPPGGGLAETSFTATRAK